MAQPIVNQEMVEKDVFGGCPIKGQPPCKIQVSPMSTPFSQMSSDPLTPSLSHLPDPMASPQLSCSGIPFTRTYSGGSTVVPDSAPMTPLMPFQTDPSNELSFRPFGSFSLDPSMGLAFSRTVSCESSFVIEEQVNHQPSDSPSPYHVPEKKVEELEELLEEVMAMYHAKYPLDHVDDSSHEVGCDADGMSWVQYVGQGRSQVEKLQDLCSEVKDLYNAKYPLDHVDDVETEVGHDLDGLLWVRYTGSGGHLSDQMQQLEELLEEVKRLYGKRYPLDCLEDEGQELGYDADGLLWVNQTGLGNQFVLQHEGEEKNKSVRSTSKMEQMQDMLSEVKRLYNEKYPLDCVDDLSYEAGCDADGLLWVRYSGAGQVAALEAAA
mmetsp:Transcript_26630/g.70665  ORF Transcript_26630/g.70665 Transcript_26630/m.70665 type:complete len:379 (+) Transcript_26630:82-1218(+)